MNKREKYLDAAMKVSKKRIGCCDALYKYDMEMQDSFDEIFEPSAFINMKYNEGLFNAWWFGDFTKENQLARSLALLFMAELDK